jgi:GNAT superfamily N-acetyltransferase
MQPEASVRQMTEADIPGVVRLQTRAFPKLKPWTPQQLRRHMTRFPEGQLVTVDATGRVIGSASALVVRWEGFADHLPWGVVTEGGSFRTHCLATGDTLYGADIGVEPEAHGQGIGAALYAARRALARRLGLRRIGTAGRIVGYAAVADMLSAEAYVQEVVAGLRHDPVLSFQLREGFVVRGVIPRYIPSDRASRGHGVVLEWCDPAWTGRRVPACRIKPAPARPVRA